jgi:uncharacterized protein (DUF362 family)
MRRRTFVGFGIASSSGCSMASRHASPVQPVAILRAPNYDADLTSVIRHALRLAGIEVRGKRVVIKPNLVEFSNERPINTNPQFVRAAMETLLEGGAASVVIAEGPGHRRDTWGLLEESGYWSGIPGIAECFVDLNVDDVAPVEGFPGIDTIFLPKTALRADIIVSLAKMKTHHWAGVTLSMKNLFGLVPSGVYGWPKNQLHWIGIDRSIAALNRIFPQTIALIDGIVGMEGDGPIRGSAKPMRVVVASPSVVAADASCCRLMGIDPEKLRFFGFAEDLGSVQESAIQQRGETIAECGSTFALVPHWKQIRMEGQG